MCTIHDTKFGISSLFSIYMSNVENIRAENCLLSYRDTHNTDRMIVSLIYLYKLDKYVHGESAP